MIFFVLVSCSDLSPFTDPISTINAIFGVLTDHHTQLTIGSFLCVSQFTCNGQSANTLLASFC